jgi:hypothetical protein
MILLLLCSFLLGALLGFLARFPAPEPPTREKLTGTFPATMEEFTLLRCRGW